MNAFLNSFDFIVYIVTCVRDKAPKKDNLECTEDFTWRLFTSATLLSALLLCKIN